MSSHCSVQSFVKNLRNNRIQLCFLCHSADSNHSASKCFMVKVIEVGHQAFFFSYSSMQCASFSLLFANKKSLNAAIARLLHVQFEFFPCKHPTAFLGGFLEFGEIKFRIWRFLFFPEPCLNFVGFCLFRHSECESWDVCLSSSISSDDVAVLQICHVNPPKASPCCQLWLRSGLTRDFERGGNGIDLFLWICHSES